MFEKHIAPAWVVQCSAENISKEWSPGTQEASLPLRLEPDACGRAHILFDFGTELEGILELVLYGGASTNVFVRFGESFAEAAGMGVPGQHPDPVEVRHIASGSEERCTYSPRGFRMIAIEFYDLTESVELRLILARARFFGKKRKGDLECSDERTQRAWQTSVYTARLCTRGEAFWDGVKRDRHGWYGDARITQQMVDSVFAEADPARSMLLQLQTDAWANQIPGYSFDAIAMFRQWLLTHGVLDGAHEIYARIRQMMNWVRRTQLDGRGFLTRREEVPLFFGIGFLDWSPMPIGGRLEELSWAQCRLLEGIQLAREVALLLDEKDDAEHYDKWAVQFQAKIQKTFWLKDGQFCHTLNMGREDCEMLLPDNHAVDTYEKQRRLGPSGATRHSATWAVLSGLADSPVARASLLGTLRDYDGPETITPYFRFYEASALARLGQPTEGVRYFSDYVIEQIERFNSATVWESYEPHIQDFRAWGLTSSWPKSLCHGWSSGLVPLIQRYICGVQPTGVGYSALCLTPSPDCDYDLELTIPTPRGAIDVSRSTGDPVVRYKVPEGVRCSAAGVENVKVERY